MRYVSYVRDMTEDGNESEVQQANIDRWMIKNTGGLPVKVYVDDYGSTKGLQSLLDDGADRRFDCVVLDSLASCGENRSQTRYALLKVLSPAGIHFLCVKDGFCSEGKSEQEVDAYFKGKKPVSAGGTKRGRKPATPEALLDKRMIDAESGEPLTALVLPYDEVEGMVLERLREEKHLAQCVMGRLTDCSEELDLALDPIREKATRAYAETAILLRQNIFPEFDAFEGIMEEADEINKAFSPQNPWAKTYANLKIGERLTAELARKAVPEVLVSHDGSVSIRPAEEKWKQMLPKEWIEE